MNAHEQTHEQTYEAPQTIRQMLVAAWALLYSLPPQLRATAQRPMDDPARLDWDFIPKPDRSGVQLAELDRHQLLMAHNLITAGLSLTGYAQVLQVMQLEQILRQLETQRLGIGVGAFRDSQGYFLTFFGRPGFEDTWGWRLLGHHISLSYTIVEQRWLSVTPFNLGAQPAEVGSLAPLRVEESHAFALLGSLPVELQARAVIHPVAPADYVTRQVPRIGQVEYPDHYDLGISTYVITDADREALRFRRDEPRGVPASALDDGQLTHLFDLVHSYTRRLPDEVAACHERRLERDRPDEIYFAWAGATVRGAAHYFRVQTPRTLIEFDNAVDGGNHVHTVLRDLDHDLGGDLLEHYTRNAGTGHHLNTRLTSSDGTTP
jgi:hypothetical protein